jgi:tyrosinase
MRERKDIYKLPAGDPTLEWYEKAVGAMQALPDTDPMGWTYQAAIHGIDPLPTPMAGLWAECQHGSSFFLPWHRMYVLNFERIVARHVKGLGGPSDWALPYWNYTTADPATLALPPAFRDPNLPNGATNHLYVKLRNPVANAGGAVLGPRDVSLNCLSARGNTSRGGFFGSAPPDHSGQNGGALELLPHNAIHNQVGHTPGGLMQNPDLAALDPIFWLHHSNIDRLWQVWLDCDPAHQNLTSAYWRTGVTFQFHDATGTLVTMRTTDVLDLTTPLLDYSYSDATCPAPFKVGPPGPISPAPIRPGGPTPPGPVAPSPAPIVSLMGPLQQELAGATRAALHLGDQVAEVTLPTPVTPHAFRAAVDRKPVAATATPRQLLQHITLQLEQVTSSDVAPTYDVFLNVPLGEDPNKYEDRFVARVAMFGIKQASDPRGAHGGGGQNFAFDITNVYHHLADLGQMNSKELHVSFVPVSPIGKPSVTVGRISLYFE